MSHIARTDKDEFQPSSNQDRWRLTPDAITSLRKAANARGRGLAAAGVVTPPEALCRVPLTTNDECAEPGVSADDEKKLLRWYEKQIPLLVGRTGDTKAPRRLRRNRKVAATATILIKRFYLSHSMLEREPLAHTLAAVFLAAKAEDEFVSAGELAAAVVESSDEVQRLAFRASKAEQAILQGVGYDLRVAHPHGPARALVEGVDVDVSRIEDECDKLLTTDAPLLHAPSLLAAVACLRVGGCEEKLQEVLTPEALDEATALAASSDPEDDAAALKKIRKRLKRTALWRDPPQPKKRPASSEEAYVPEEGGAAAPAAKRPRRGAAPLPGTFVGAGSDSVAQRETASVLAAVRGEAAPT